MLATGPSPLARFDVRSRDVALSHEMLREAYANFSVRLSGSTDEFRFSHSGVVAPRMSVGRIGYSMTAGIDVDAPQDRLIVAVRTGGALSLRSGRDTARPDVGQPMLMPPHAGWEAELANVALHAVTLDWAVVDGAARSVLGVDAARPDFISMAPVSDGAARYLRGVLAHVERDVLAHDDVAAHPLVLAEATRSLAAALLVTFPSTALARLDDDNGSGGQRAEPAVLRRALGYVDEHAGDDIGVDDIAAAARIGVRGLQHLFRRHRDCTPLEYLRQVRMARAHTDLRVADPSIGHRRDGRGAVGVRPPRAVLGPVPPGLRPLAERDFASMNRGRTAPPHGVPTSGGSPPGIGRSTVVPPARRFNSEASTWTRSTAPVRWSCAAGSPRPTPTWPSTSSAATTPTPRSR